MNTHSSASLHQTPRLGAERLDAVLLRDGDGEHRADLGGALWVDGGQLWYPAVEFRVRDRKGAAHQVDRGQTVCVAVHVAGLGVVEYARLAGLGAGEAIAEQLLDRVDATGVVVVVGGNSEVRDAQEC